MPKTEYRENSVGVPFSDMMAKVVKIGTEEEMGAGEEGEICVSGPTVMLGYLDEPEETASVLRKHADGRIWCHTGDVGSMDSDGFVYFKDRMKRLIKVSGFGVYPSQIEDVLNAHPDVALSCAVGVPDERQIQRIKAFVALTDPSKGGPEMERKLIEYCQKNLIKWSCPKEIEFRSELPKTRVGKVAYKELEQQELEKLGHTPDR
jgi:long-chain acyl-CoA synthetase